MVEQIHDRSAMPPKVSDIPGLPTHHAVQYFANDAAGRWFRLRGRVWQPCDVPGDWALIDPTSAAG
jgi:hypothetical protein